MGTDDICPDLDMAAFAERLLLARRRKGLSQTHLCELAGLDPTHYTRIEQGKKHGVRVTTLYKLCMALDVSSDDLLGLRAQARSLSPVVERGQNSS